MKRSYFTRTWDTSGAIPDWVERSYDDAAPAIRKEIDEMQPDRVLFLEYHPRADAPFVELPPYPSLFPPS